MKELFGPIHAYYLVITVLRAKDGDGGNTMLRGAEPTTETKLRERKTEPKMIHSNSQLHLR